MRRRYRLHPACTLLLIATLTLGGCTLLKGGEKTPPLYGQWDFTMTNASQGALTGMMTIGEAEDGTYTGHVSVLELGVDEPIMIKSLEMDGPVFTLKGYAANSDFTMTGTIDGDTMAGENNVAAVGVFTVKATRVKTP